jgi:hypothetical protein
MKQVQGTTGDSPNGLVLMDVISGFFYNKTAYEAVCERV